MEGKFTCLVCGKSKGAVVKVNIDEKGLNTERNFAYIKNKMVLSNYKLWIKTAWKFTIVVKDEGLDSLP